MSDDPVCASVRDSLAAYAAGLLPVAEQRQIERHLVGCERCSLELRQWRQFGALAREDHGPAPTPAFADAWAQLHARLASPREVALAPGAQQRRLREVQLDDITGAPLTGPARTLAPARKSGRMRYTRSFMAVAAVVALAIISASVFSALARQRQGGGPGNTASCATGQISAQLPHNAQLVDLAMTSPNDGWAVGSYLNANQVTEPLIMQYHDCRWSPVYVAALYGLDNVSLTSISMVSATEGWATFGIMPPQTGQTGQMLLHYTHGQWRRVTLPSILDGGSWISKVVMLSPDEGWLLVNVEGRTVKWTNTLVHYAHGTWSVVTPPFPFISDIATVAPNDLFIAGAQDLVGLHSYLGHYHDGVWSTTSAPGVRLGALRMLSPTDGWVVATIPSSNNLEPAGGLAPLHFNGGTWSRVDLGIPTGAYEMSVVSDNDIWAFMGPIPYHYSQGHWQTTPWQQWFDLLPESATPYYSASSVAPLVRTADGAYWTLAITSVDSVATGGNQGGNTSSVFMRYANGAWTAYGNS